LTVKEKRASTSVEREKKRESESVHYKVEKKNPPAYVCGRKRTTKVRVRQTKDRKGKEQKNKPQREKIRRKNKEEANVNQGHGYLS